MGANVDGEVVVPQERSDERELRLVHLPGAMPLGPDEAVQHFARSEHPERRSLAFRPARVLEATRSRQGASQWWNPGRNLGRGMAVAEPQAPAGKREGLPAPDLEHQGREGERLGLA